MTATRAQYKGFTLTAETLAFPNGRVIDLAHVADVKGKRARVWYRGRRMYVYRAVMCVTMGVDSLPCTLDVHHVNCDRHDCRPCNLALMGKDNHKHAHELANAIATDALNGNDCTASKRAYLDYVRTHAATI